MSIYRLLVSFSVLCVMLSGCMGSKDLLYKKLSKEDPKNTKYVGHYKVGTEYKIKNKTYTPKANTHYTEIGIASWYGSKNGFHGKKTANGDRYNKHLLSAAHRTLPLPSLVKVTSLNNNKSLILMVNDRGPFIKNRIIDVSEQAAAILGFKVAGTAKVKVQYLHQDTKEFLKNITLKSQEGATASRKSKLERCSINCHIKLANMKHKLHSEKDLSIARNF